jgi:hypothetical protein
MNLINILLKDENRILKRTIKELEDKVTLLKKENINYLFFSRDNKVDVKKLTDLNNQM